MFARNALILVAVAVMLGLASATASASTVAYWQFDSTTTAAGLTDSVGPHDLVKVGGGGTFQGSSVAAVNPVPNPDTTPWFSGDPLVNPDPGSARVALHSNGATDTGRLRASNDTGNVFNLSGKSFTFEGWFQHDTTSTPSGFGDIIGGTRDASPWGGYVVRMLPDGGISAYFAEAGGGADSFSVSTSGTDYRGAAGDYHHFALTWEDGAGGNFTGLAGLYIDGVPEASGSAPAAFNAATADSNDNAFVMAGRGVSDNKWHGRFDEFRFSNQALSPSEFLNGTTPVSVSAVLVDINADGTNRNAMTADFEAATGLSAGTFSGEPVNHFPNNNPGGGPFSQAVNGITIQVSDISNDADNWFGAGSDNNLLDDGLYHRDGSADPTALIALSGSGLGLEPLRVYELYLFAGRSQGHETTFTFDPNDPLDPSGGLAIDVDPPVVGGDNTLGTALFTFATGAIAPSSLVIQWDGARHINGNQDAVFSGFALRDIGVIPEPSTLLIWSALGAVLGFGVRRRRSR